MTFNEYYNNHIFETIDRHRLTNSNCIFVLQGQSSLMDLNIKKSETADFDTFFLEKDAEVFSKTWASKVQAVLNEPKDYHLMSFAQFTYLMSYIAPSTIIDRVVLLVDNLRQLFPIDAQDYRIPLENESFELRPEDLPLYQTEQLALNGKYYYLLQTTTHPCSQLILFDEMKELECPDVYDLECVAVGADQLSLDIFVNECIAHNHFGMQAVVTIYHKQLTNNTFHDTLRRINALMNRFGGNLVVKEELSLDIDHTESERAQAYLYQYWGENSAFRTLPVYRNPHKGNQITNISQGLIVETIMAEYDCSVKHAQCRDLFLTAPTGTGKSLLFQLPAFYVSDCGDVTIVISPLIALMKDQVEAIIKDRNFKKVAYINGELSLSDRNCIIENCREGLIDVLYMSPELLLTYGIGYFIGSRKPGLLVIDEAHLITTWGRDFRVDYWFLGNYIQKIRKHHNLCFPMVALTATAIYGGENDMVFDSIKSLLMHNPHIFIGQVKREDIEFVINNHEVFAGNYEKNKLNQTVDFIKQANDSGMKTLVYTPFKKHAQIIHEQVNAYKANTATLYHGSLDMLNKEFSYLEFKSGEKKIMISTKAFGMGVDIADIEVVYHHAPSGLLADYVQEIGRVARKPEIKGYATINYSPQDQAYTKILHRLSALRQYQLKAVLKKIYKTYLKHKNSRNLYLSVDDFGYIFDNSSDLNQKVMTALMMIEKDYLAKNQFNVLVARPLKRFVKVYARISKAHFEILSAKYPDTFKLISSAKNDNYNLEIDLDTVWYNHFIYKSFPTIKKDFFVGKLFSEDKINLTPQIKMTYERLDDFSQVREKLQLVLHTLQTFFSKAKGYFKQTDLQELLNSVLQHNEQAKTISKYILSSYTGKLTRPGTIESNTFLQSRRTADVVEYRVSNCYYLTSFESIENRLNSLFEHTGETVVERYVNHKEANRINYIRLGYLLEIMELGTFEIKGRENVSFFMRINDPERIVQDANSSCYSNSLLANTLKKHSLSNQIFDHFFLQKFSNTERWSFIEDFFLGADLNELLDNYKGNEANQIDMVEVFKKIPLQRNEITTTNQPDSTIHIFQPSLDKVYNLNDLLTIDFEGSVRTMKITKWLSEDPVVLDKVRRNMHLVMQKEVMEILISKLNAHHPEYAKKSLGLKRLISFKGYQHPVPAQIPYSNNPIEFYKWWSQHENEVAMSLAEKIKLFDIVFMTKPTVLTCEHKNLIKKKK